MYNYGLNSCFPLISTENRFLGLGKKEVVLHTFFKAWCFEAIPEKFGCCSLLESQGFCITKISGEFWAPLLMGGFSARDPSCFESEFLSVIRRSH
jgi:hypothetical protein